jgi:hypothetical protein
MCIFILMQAGKRARALSLFRQGIKENNFSEVQYNQINIDWLHASNNNKLLPKILVLVCSCILSI